MAMEADIVFQQVEAEKRWIKISTQFLNTFSLSGNGGGGCEGGGPTGEDKVEL